MKNLQHSLFVSAFALSAAALPALAQEQVPEPTKTQQAFNASLQHLGEGTLALIVGVGGTVFSPLTGPLAVPAAITGVLGASYGVAEIGVGVTSLSLLAAGDVDAALSFSSEAGAGLDVGAASTSIFGFQTLLYSVAITGDIGDSLTYTFMAAGGEKIVFSVLDIKNALQNPSLLGIPTLDSSQNEIGEGIDAILYGPDGPPDEQPAEAPAETPVATDTPFSPLPDEVESTLAPDYVPPGIPTEDTTPSGPVNIPDLLPDVVTDAMAPTYDGPLQPTGGEETTTTVDTGPTETGPVETPDILPDIVQDSLPPDYAPPGDTSTSLDGGDPGGTGVSGGDGFGGDSSGQGGSTDCPPEPSTENMSFSLQVPFSQKGSSQPRIILALSDPCWGIPQSGTSPV